MRIDRRARSWLLAFSALSLLAGCPGTLADKALYEAALDGADHPNRVDGAASADAGPCGDVVARIFVPTCGGTACHGSDAPQQDLDLVSPAVASRVVGVAGKGCAVLLADPADPESSLIYQKLSPTPPCGAPMPLARPPLSRADAACVLAWIAAQ
ncbi:MAG TPA: hypothetical protein VK550_08795 [Polyangiaceae bacterium]|nr:hypothetical protein [Polyangiaceae bacterium]